MIEDLTGAMTGKIVFIKSDINRYVEQGVLSSTQQATRFSFTYAIHNIET